MTISGQVQGVGFRWYCREQAMALRLQGYVRNLPDGRVEAAFEGAGHDVDAMVAWCRTGPDLADVTGMQAFEEPPIGASGFRIAR